MLTDSLIDDTVWADLPDDNEEAFLLLATSARRRLEDILTGGEEQMGRHSGAVWKRTFVHEISGAAEALDIGGIMPASQAEQNTESLDMFSAVLSRRLTMIKLSIRSKLKIDTTVLKFTTKASIRDALEELRSAVAGSNLSEELKSSLHRKIEAVERELDQSRFSMRTLWQLAGALGCVAAGGVGFAAELPSAIDTVNKAVALVHHDRADEINRAAAIHSPGQITYQPQRLLTNTNAALETGTRK